MLFQASGQSRPLDWSEMLGCASVGVAAVVLARCGWAVRVAAAAARSMQRLDPPSLGVIMALGLTLRVMVQWLVEPAPASDGASYVHLAQQLITQGDYGSDGARAYWPPGMAFVLVPLLAVAPLSIALGAYGLACFLMAALGLQRLGERLGLGTHARWAPLVLAIWPTHWMMSGLPEKELLVMALLPWILWAGWEAYAAEGRWAIGWSRGLVCGLLTGLLMGAVILLQPAFQLLPLFAATLALLAGLHWRRVVGTLVVVILGAAFIVTPWTLRNLAVLGEPVLVSTNGGSNLYRVNNERATGGYIAVGKIDLDVLPELEAHREGKRLAVEWIQNHPGDFVTLTAGRILLFPGDHSVGAYAAFRSAPERVPRPVYLAMKAGTAATWLALWALVLAVVWTYWRARQPLPSGALLLLLPWLYLSGIHAFFESGSKYHLPALGLVLLLVVLLVRGSPAVVGHTGPRES